MANYLLHQRRDGQPIGVFTETEHFYLANQKMHEDYGVAVVESRGSEAEWEDWIEQLASKSPSPKAMWDIYEHPITDLEQVLNDARAATSYE